MSTKKKSVKKKKKISNKFDEFKEKNWVSELPKPDVPDDIWGKHGAEDLAFYIDWHKRHPHCNSPRIPDRDIDTRLKSNMFKDEHDPNLYYVKTNYGDAAVGELPKEYHPNYLGSNCDTESVTHVSTRLELEQKIINLRDYEDPWYERSVRDTLNYSHADGWKTPKNIFKSPIFRCEENSGSAVGGRSFIRSGVKIHMTPETFTAAKDLNPNNLDALATKFDADKPKFIGRDAKVKIGPFEELRDFTSYTKNGKYLGVWKQKELDGWIEEGLKQYEQDIKDEEKAARKKAKMLERLREQERLLAEQEVPESPTPRESKKKRGGKVAPSDASTVEGGGGGSLDSMSMSMSMLTTSIGGSTEYPPSSPNPNNQLEDFDNDCFNNNDNDDDNNDSSEVNSGDNNHDDGLDKRLTLKKILKAEKREQFELRMKEDADRKANELMPEDAADGDGDGDGDGELEYMDEEKRMKLKLGGDDAIEKITNEWVSFAQWVRKKAKKRGNLFNFSGDLADACDKGDYIRAYAIMVMGASPNILHEDRPLFYHIFEKIVKMDQVLGTLKVGDKLTADQQKLHSVLDVMMKFSCNIDVINQLDGFAAVHIAAAIGSTRLVSWLIDHHCKLDIKSKERFTAIMYAVKYGHVYTIAEIIKRGGVRFLHEPDEERRTPLHHAAMYGQTRVAKFLIKVGADKKKTDLYKMQPGQLAQEHGYEVTAQLILTFARMPPKTEDQLQYILDEGSRKQASLQDTVKDALSSISNLFSSGMSMFGSMYTKK